MLRLSRGSGVAVVLAIVLMLIAWAPMMALADSGNSQAPADPPGLSEEPPGNSGEAPGQVAKTETETPPGNSGDAPGQNKASSGDAPDHGKSAAPGQNKTDTSGVAPPKSTNAGGKSGSHQDKDSSGVPEGKGDGPTNGVGGNCDGDPSGGSNTGNGANSSGDFDNTCDTAPSGPAPNGNGGGKSKGKPCAGCVGNADDKNPPGQSKGDHNNGYECEPDPNGKGNKGVGGGNPAHTGCTTTGGGDLCPTGTDKAGTAIPAGQTAASFCDIPDGDFCPTGTDRAGTAIPAGQTAASFCDESSGPDPDTCPVGSDQNAGEVIPEGETAESFCELDEVDPVAITCPEDATQNAGEVIPEGETETSFCVEDLVLGEIIEKDPKPVFPGGPVVAGEILGGPEPQGAVLPFTGGSILPVLIVSLTLLGAGGATLYRRREASEERAAA